MYNNTSPLYRTAGTGNIKASVIYDKLCLCNGVCPKVIVQNANVIGLRDNNSVEDLVCRLKKARKVVVVGNGGIALELIHEVFMVIKCAILKLTYYIHGLLFCKYFMIYYCS